MSKNAWLELGAYFLEVYEELHIPEYFVFDLQKNKNDDIIVDKQIVENIDKVAPNFH